MTSSFYVRNIIKYQMNFGVFRKCVWALAESIIVLTICLVAFLITL